MKLEDIHFHDARLLQVVEYPEVDDSVLRVDYPVDWENNIFEPRSIVFHDVLNYTVEEGPFSGRPTLLDDEEITSQSNRQRVILKTNAGTRSLEFSSVDLTTEYKAQPPGGADTVRHAG
jgi:hypothetical protein